MPKKYECLAKIVSSVRMETIADSPEDAERLFKRKQANLTRVLRQWSSNGQR